MWFFKSKKNISGESNKSELERTRSFATTADWQRSHGCSHNWVFDRKREMFGMERTYYHCANCGMSGKEDWSKEAGWSRHIW
ncbi:MAG: hypothetical protein KGV46_00725 [Pasteurella sp.]|nr:hypothetical protein [Pasteurella sp.]